MIGNHKATIYMAAAGAILAMLGTVKRALADVFNMGSSVKSLQFVPVGNPSNSADPRTGFGRVTYSYSMGEYDITTSQYVEFLNAVATTSDTYSLYNANMFYSVKNGNTLSGSPASCGIVKTVTGGVASYSVISGHENFPVNYVNWTDAIRFANWLSNGQAATGTETSASTENGSYNLVGVDGGASLSTVVRAVGATYVVPNENEWYKAAYYKGGSTSAGYWKYATQNNTAPGNALPDTGNNGNLYTTQYADPTNFLTPVGDFSLSPSAYGTFDQDGDVFNWTETASGSNRLLEGAPYENGYQSFAEASTGDTDAPTDSMKYYGFRIAEVPEPGSLGLLAVGAVGLLRKKLRLRA